MNMKTEKKIRNEERGKIQKSNRFDISFDWTKNDNREKQQKKYIRIENP